MPMNSELYGTNGDGSSNKDYCMYCYLNGDFISDITMEEMINFCVPKMVENSEFNELEARKMIEKMFPTLKRWK